MNRKTLTRTGFTLLVVAAAILALTGVAPVIYAFGCLLLALLVSPFEPGDRTKMQMQFGVLAAALALATVHFQLSGWCWVGVGVFAFLCATMKLDGGDEDTGA